MSSVLQDWVMQLPLRAQGTLLTGIRGCDLTPKTKETLQSTERQLVGYIRFCVMHPADSREVGMPGAFFQSEPPQDWKPSELGHYPQHWYSHIMHVFEIIAYCNPNPWIRNEAGSIYSRLVENMHLKIESYDSMMTRLTEDRILSNKVVS